MEEFLKSGLWTVVGAVLGFLLKSFWDRFWKRQDELRTKRIELIERQLSEFYIPIYFRLQKDNIIWRRILDRENKDEIKKKVGTEIDKSVILPNHEEIVKILETKFHLARANKELSDQFLLYLRHTAVLKALRTSGITDIDPVYLGEPWAKELFPLVEVKMKGLQEEYDRLLDLQNK